MQRGGGEGVREGTLMCPNSVMRMFSGLRSLYENPRSWRDSNAAATSLIIDKGV